MHLPPTLCKFSASFSESCQVAYAHWWNWSVCARTPVCACVCVFVRVRGRDDLYARLKWVLCFGWWWPRFVFHLSNSASLGDIESERGRRVAREGERKTELRLKTVDMFVKVKVCLLKHLFPFANSMCWQKFLFIYLSCRHKTRGMNICIVKSTLKLIS